MAGAGEDASVLDDGTADLGEDALLVASTSGPGRTWLTGPTRSARSAEIVVAVKRSSLTVGSGTEFRKFSRP